MERKFTKIVLLICCMVSIQLSFGQIAITGKVTDSETGEPLIGVTVSLLGAAGSVTTNNEGNYSIQAASSGTLRFTYVGYLSQETAIDNRTIINVKLSQETSTLEQVVVVGYGTQSKRNVTGSISSVDMSQSDDLPNTNVAQSLRGVAGVQFTSSGRPGQDGNIIIRGQNSLSATNSPLIVLDGIIFNGSLSDINPQDIQSIDILKDASSASIYGSKAANGVILITSKRGTSDKAIIGFNGFYGVSDFAKKVKLLSAERYLQRIVDYRMQSGLPVDKSRIEEYLNASEAENYLSGISSDPWDIASQRSTINTYNLNLSGKASSTNYYLSGSTSNEKGLIFNDNQRRTSFRVNIENEITQWLNIGMNSTFSHRDQSGVNADLYDVYRNSPYGTWFYPDGEPTQFPVKEEQASGNPLRNSLLTTNKEVYNNLFTNFYVNIDIPFLDGLSYRSNYSPNYRWDLDYNFFRQDKYLLNNTTYASKYNKNTFDWMLENILTYKKALDQNNVIDVTLLYGRNHTDFESTFAHSNLLSIDALGFHNLGLGSVFTNNSLAEKVEGISSMARLNYTMARKYILTLTARRDGSSVFSENNKYATFPSASFAWIISDEPFLQKNKFVDMMKFRVSYGSVGNQAIVPYQSLSLSDEVRYVFGDGGNSSLGVLPSTISNRDLKWETSYTFNGAIDFELFKGRIGGTLEYYNTSTRDLLVERSIPTMTGFDRMLTNIGETNNRGIEASINSTNIRKGLFQWTSSLALSYNKNKIVHLYNTDLDGDGKEDDDLSNNWFIGQPITSFYDYVFDGIYQEEDKDIPVGHAPGWVRLKDLNNDGKIDARDRTIVGSGGDPKYRISLYNNFSYRNFSLSLMITSMFDWVAPFGLLNPLTHGRSINQLDDGWWTAENRSNTRASLVYTNPLGHNWYVSRNFMRIQDVSFSYELTPNALNRIKLSNVRLFVSAKNLYTFTNWLGSDPESGGSYASSQGSNELFPMPRTVTFGLNFSL